MNVARLAAARPHRLDLETRVQAGGQRQLVGVTGSGLIGRDPFDRKAWSTSSYHFFTALQSTGALHRAFGVEVPSAERYLIMTRNFRPNRTAWRETFYLDPAYRYALTRQIRKQIRREDLAHDFLQLGAMYDVPSLLRGKARCFSYHDGNLAERLRSPHPLTGVSRKDIDRALAYEREVYHGITIIFAMSEYLRQSFIHDFDVPPERILSIGAGMNLAEIPAHVPDKRYDSQEILFIGVEFQRKGGWDLLKAFRGVHERYPRSKLHIVGPRELTLPSELQRGVVFHGYLDRNDPGGRATSADLFRRCSVFAMPSLYEPFGIAALEAMAHQIPCVLTGQWAFKEMVTPGLNGELVEAGSADDIEAKLSALLSDPDRLRRMGEAGRQRVLEQYTWAKVVERLVEAVQDAKGTKGI